MFNNISHTQTQQEDDTLWKTQLNMPSVGEFFPTKTKEKGEYHQGSPGNPAKCTQMPRHVQEPRQLPKGCTIKAQNTYQHTALHTSKLHIQRYNYNITVIYDKLN